jgi:signal transduction histidine kinase
MTYGAGRTSDRADTDFSAAGSFERYMGRLPAAFAVTSGSLHTLVYANAAFRGLVAPDGVLLLGRPIAESFPIRDMPGMTALLDQTFQSGIVSRDRGIELLRDDALLLSCTVWPDVNPSGEAEHLVIELRATTQEELMLGVQRDVAERLLLSALRDQDAADAAEHLRRDAAFLAAESRRLAESLDEQQTLEAMAGMSLPYVGDWCIVDTFDESDRMHRLAIIHPDPAKQALLDQLDGRWKPHADDGFGLPAALRNAKPLVIADEVEAVLANSAHDTEIIAAVRALGVGPLLTVPLIIRERLIGAVTFVGGLHDRPFTPNDVQLAEDLASRSATALDRARAYGEAIALKVRADAANQAKSAFLGMMSHELRTPLNAIGGYVDLLDMEIHGPVTEAQRIDLARIRTNQRYLMGLISDLLNFTKVGSGHLAYDVADIDAHEMLASTVALVDPLILQKGLIYDVVECHDVLVARGDPDRVTQILVNLLSNGIKFTPAGGHLTVDCEASEHTIKLRVTDTGIGIAPDKLEVIFDPFVQVVRGSAGAEAGIGLGLAISRGLARGMEGDLTVESRLGGGSRFTLTLPRAKAKSP